MSTTTLDIRFSAVDSLYFRGSRPHCALASEFPPPISTFTGAIRTRLGDALGVDWHRLQTGKQQHLAQLADISVTDLMGDADSTGLLIFSQPQLYWYDEPLYPVPAVLMQHECHLVRLKVGAAVHCDLGYVHLPELPANIGNAKPLENSWITQAGLQLFLQGKLPDAQHIIKQADVLVYESRLGIGRNLETASVESGLLYQTEHVRMHQKADFAVQVTLPERAAQTLLHSINTQPLQRFGGEGRMAELIAKVVTTTADTTLVSHPTVLMLMTDMLPVGDFATEPLPGFSKTSYKGVDCWQGELAGIALRLLSVVAGKARKHGGWDMRNHKPRAMQSFVPAGSCFFIEPLNIQDDLTGLNGLQIGRNTTAGFGSLMCVR